MPGRPGAQPRDAARRRAPRRPRLREHAGDRPRVRRPDLPLVDAGPGGAPARALLPDRAAIEIDGGIAAGLPSVRDAGAPAFRLGVGDLPRPRPGRGLLGLAALAAGCRASPTPSATRWRRRGARPARPRPGEPQPPGRGVVLRDGETVAEGWHEGPGPAARRGGRPGGGRRGRARRHGGLHVGALLPPRADRRCADAVVAAGVGRVVIRGGRPAGPDRAQEAGGAAGGRDRGRRRQRRRRRGLRRAQRPFLTGRSPAFPT